MKALFEVAARVADPRDALGREARAHITGLSREGIELALTRYLERDADYAALAAWATPAPRCFVLLAANVCTAALRALVCAAAVSARVFVKPSRRDPVLATILAREVGFALVDDLAEVEARDAVHLYGSDDALAALRAGLPAGVQVLAHGSGFGVAIASPEEASLVARDLVVFDGAGCLSPRVVLSSEPERFAVALHDALSASLVPRGPLSGPDRAALVAARTTFEAVGAAFEGPHHLVVCDPAPQAIALVPPLRTTAVYPMQPELLAPLARHITTIGGGELAFAPRARRAKLGEMQLPPLDGPVDLR
jgi:hypothetical protein